MLKRALPCLLLLALHACPVGCDAASVAVDGALDLDDVIDSRSRGNDASAPLDDDLDDAQPAVARRMTNKSNIAPAMPMAVPKPFLRKSAKPKRAGREIFRKAFDRALGGGIPGAIAGVVQVLALMWLRTVINYQYRYGSTFLQAFTTLYGMGGIPRLYSGISFALIQAPLSRFVSTAANDGVSVLLQHLNWGPGREVMVAAFVVGFFRMMLMPIDTCKTVLQIESASGLAQLMDKVRKGNVHLLYSGALANAVSSFIGHYPWFYTYNLLSRNEALAKSIPWTTGRNALIGFVSSIVSDTVANSMRVIKTSKQAMGSTHSQTSYAETISVILAVDGWRGLFGRGLKTRILGNALQSILFTVVWRGLSERWQGERRDASPGTVEDSLDNDDDMQQIQHDSTLMVKR